MQRPFETKVEGTPITGIVDKPDNQELCDYYVTANIGDFVFKFRMILVSTPPLYAVNLIEIWPADRTLGRPQHKERMFVAVQKDMAEWVFSSALTLCLNKYKSLMFP